MGHLAVERGVADGTDEEDDDDRDQLGVRLVGMLRHGLCPEQHEERVEAADNVGAPLGGGFEDGVDTGAPGPRLCGVVRERVGDEEEEAAAAVGEEQERKEDADDLSRIRQRVGVPRDHLGDAREAEQANVLEQLRQLGHLERPSECRGVAVAVAAWGLVGRRGDSHDGIDGEAGEEINEEPAFQVVNRCVS